MAVHAQSDLGPVRAGIRERQSLVNKRDDRPRRPIRVWGIYALLYGRVVVEQCRLSHASQRRGPIHCDFYPEHRNNKLRERDSPRACAPFLKPDNIRNSKLNADTDTNPKCNRNAFLIRYSVASLDRIVQRNPELGIDSFAVFFAVSTAKSYRNAGVDRQFHCVRLSE